MPRRVKTLQERFLSHVNKDGANGCWLWTASCYKNGYGQFSINDKKCSAHRASYIIYKGEPGTLKVCHTCDNPPCVNPDHLFLGTQRKNMDDMVEKGRQCRGIKNGMSILNEEIVRKMKMAFRNDRIENGRYDRLMVLFPGIAKGTIRAIVYNHRWKHINLDALPLPPSAISLPEGIL